MALKAGERLGPYEILTPLGAGGMGEVYKAKDTRLDRTVAIKVLPSHLSDNAQLRERPWPFLQTPFDEGEPKFSPDGRWLAYHSNESGRFEVYVRPFPKAEEGKSQISTEGGMEPVWAGNGELFYRNGDQMMAVDITTEPSLSAGTPRLLFEGRYNVMPFPLTNYDVTSDGQRFLMIKSDEEEATQLNVVLNWFEELKRLVPTEN